MQTFTLYFRQRKLFRNWQKCPHFRQIQCIDGNFIRSFRHSDKAESCSNFLLREKATKRGLREYDVLFCIPQRSRNSGDDEKFYLKVKWATYNCADKFLNVMRFRTGNDKGNGELVFPLVLGCLRKFHEVV